MKKENRIAQMHPDPHLEAPKDRELFQEAWHTARARHGTDITFYLPGMIRYGGRRGRYPAVSITGTACRLQCEHCRGKLLEPMIPAETPEAWSEKARRLWRHGAHGILISGGSDSDGRLPWKRFAPAIGRIARETGLSLTAHAGFPDAEACGLLRETGVRQALIDVMGDDDTSREIYHLPSLGRVIGSLDALAESGPPLAPHIVAGLYYGRIRAETEAVQILRGYDLDCLVFVVLTALPGTPMETVSPPPPLDTARLIARARVLLPDVPLSLGCERPRDRTGRALESLALRAGISRMAVWSEEAVVEARQLGLTPRFQATCCSLPYSERFSFSNHRTRESRSP
ncbi:MAG: radical SAM protein [Thermodesulfobacteriota bacterium]